MDNQPPKITALLMDWSKGNREALEHLTPIVYAELRKLAAAYLRRERSDHTLQPTALIHEAYVRLVDQDMPDWKGRAHFYGVAAQIMCQILVDYARSKSAAKRGGDQKRVPLAEGLPDPAGQTVDFLALHKALDELEAFDERKAKVIELRYFGGMSIDETAEALGVSVATVGRELRFSEAWLNRRLAAFKEEDPQPGQSLRD